MNWKNNRTTSNFYSGSVNNACDPSACFDSFKQHWQQAYKIISKNNSPKYDDVLSVVNHLDQFMMLLLMDRSNSDSIILLSKNSETVSPYLQFLLKEDVLNKLHKWGLSTGRYSEAVGLEQLKLFNALIQHSRQKLLAHEPFVTPLLKLLNSCQRDMFEEQFENTLVTLLNQLCVLLMQNMDLKDLFFCGPAHSEPKFIICSLLMPFIQRSGPIGLSARDALMLCMSLSKKNKDFGFYIANKTNILQHLATSLSVLYSALPHRLQDVELDDWHRFTPDDVNDIPDLATFVSFLEFTDAVAQGSHEIVRVQLEELVQKGFLVPVLGAALLQSEYDKQVASTAFLDLILRSVTEAGLLPTIIKFLTQITFGEQNLLPVLIRRIQSDSRLLCLVTLGLFETLVNLNNEELMVELIFKYLEPCRHLASPSHRGALTELDVYYQGVEVLEQLAPRCCWEITDATTTAAAADAVEAGAVVVNWRRYASQTGESLFGNRHAYLCDARAKVAACRAACSQWSARYDGTDDPGDATEAGPGSLANSSGYGSLAHRDRPDHVEKPDLGLFLTVLLNQLEKLVTNDVYINLHLTGLISRLAIYPQPLLRGYLLNVKLSLQPNIRTIHQVISKVTREIDEDAIISHRNMELDIRLAIRFLIEREQRLESIRRRALESQQQAKLDDRTQQRPSSGSAQPLRQSESKRRSITSSISQLFRRISHSTSFSEDDTASLTSQQSATTTPASPTAVTVPAAVASSSPTGAMATEPFRTSPVAAIRSRFQRPRAVALAAVILSEWTKELAAISMEHTIADLSVMLT